MTSVESHECTIVLRDVCLYLEGSDPRLNARYGGPKIRGFLGCLGVGIADGGSMAAVLGFYARIFVLLMDDPVSP